MYRHIVNGKTRRSNRPSISECKLDFWVIVLSDSTERLDIKRNSIALTTNPQTEKLHTGARAIFADCNRLALLASSLVYQELNLAFQMDELEPDSTCRLARQL